MTEPRYFITGGSGFIGTNLIKEIISADGQILNFDVRTPILRSHLNYWTKGDILDQTGLNEAIARFCPTHIVHLAARTDTQGVRVEEYPVNVDGTRNLLEAVANSKSILRLIITSTQYVFRPGRLPCDDVDYDPYFAYGASKVRTEQLTRAIDPECIWTIIRPTNVWGAWHERFPSEIWRWISRGLYVHPADPPVFRSYGYVKNVVWQILRLFERPPEDVHRKTFYVGDRPRDSYDWVNGFSTNLTGRKVRKIPRSLLFVLAIAGEFARKFGLRAPIYISRYRNLTVNYLTPMDSIFSLLGEPPYSLEEGIEETCVWLRNESRQGAT